MAKKKATKPSVPGVVDTSTEIKRTNRLYLAVREIGQCNDKDKSVLALGYSGKIIAKPDQPFGIMIALLEEMLPVMDYSTPEAAAADIERFKKYVNSLEANTNDKAGSGEGTGTDLPNGGSDRTTG